jgi:hypothetical protein
MHYVATPEDKMAGTMSFAILTDAIAVAMEQWSVQHHVKYYGTSSCQN